MAQTVPEGRLGPQELAKLSTQDLVTMAARLEAALRVGDFKTAFSIAVPLSSAISSKANASTNPKPNNLREEISQMEAVLDRVGPAGNPLVRGSIAVRALAVGDFAKARVQAEMAIADLGRVRYPESSTVAPDTLHISHIVLGTVAVRTGDLASARQELLRAGRVSPGTSAFPGPQGPDFSLAQALFEKGETATVLEYLAAVRVWWAPGARQLDQWSAAIRGGGAPVFPASGRGF